MGNKILNWFVFGAIAFLLVSFVAPWIIGEIVKASGVTGITFATYNVRQEWAALAANGNPFASMVLSWIGGGIQIPGAILGAVGVGAAVALVAFLFDFLKLNGMVGKYKIPVVLVVANIVAGIVVAKALPTFSVMPLLFMAVSGLLVAYLMEFIYKQMKWQLPN